MKRTFILKTFLVLLFSVSSIFASYGQANFSYYFTGQALRIDYILTGNASESILTLEQFKIEPFWGGSVDNTLSPFNYGEFRIEVYDQETKELIFMKGFSTLFQEWQTTAEAKTMSRSFYQVSRIPFPKNVVVLKISKRETGDSFVTLLETNLDPQNYFIINEKPLSFPVEVILENGDPAHKVDLVFLPEGYTRGEMQDFRDDVLRLSEVLFSFSPYKEMKSSFNVRAVMAPSDESGTDYPGEGIYKNTIMNFSYYTFDLARYLTSKDVRSIRDLAGIVPYDHIIVLINAESYGGGGIFNHYSASTSDNHLSPIVMVHEMGHGFAGLGDEYYTSDVAYEEFYKLDEEPWEPNLTTLVDFSSKWESMLEDSIPIPTPNTSDYVNTIGVFEGGGYVPKGVYRPYSDCIMKSNEPSGFCPVCREAIRKMILYYCGKE